MQWASELSPAGVVACAGYLVFAVASVVLAIVDARTHRLPSRIVLPSLAVVTSLLVAAALLAGERWRIWSMLGAGIALFALFFAFAFASPTGIGGGDVKLAPLVGVVLGYIGWDAVLLGVFAGFLFAAAFGLALVLCRHSKWRDSIAFGPWMLAGAWVATIYVLVA